MSVVSGVLDGPAFDLTRKFLGKEYDSPAMLAGIPMVIAVVSELWPYPERRAEYEALAKEIRPLLEAIDGFISAERFESSTEPATYLSFSLWRDEAALARWRNLEEHRVIMAKGRGGILRDYHIRATSVLWDYSLENRTEAPADSRALYG